MIVDEPSSETANGDTHGAIAAHYARRCTRRYARRYAHRPVIIALDFDSAREADALVSTLGDSAGFYKVGIELFAAAGKDYVRSLVGRGKRVFLDLKYYDIGETAKRAVAVAAKSGATFLTVHAVGQVMSAAIEGRDAVREIQISNYSPSRS